jgi:DNA polymerase III psi subunit
MHKRKSFAHEREVRIVDQQLPKIDGGIKIGIPNNLKGVHVKVDLSHLIENVYVAPTAPKWYFNLVKEVLKIYQIKKDIISSVLDEEPVF